MRSFGYFRPATMTQAVEQASRLEGARFVAGGTTIFDYSKEVREMAIAAQSIPQPEQAEDLVGACLFLASDGARMMTGQVLAVDGGTAVH